VSRPQHDPPAVAAAISMLMTRYRRGVAQSASDLITVEEPLEIRVVVETAGRRERHVLAVTMRTPGEDPELAAGFLVSEGVISAAEDIWRIEHCHDGPESTDDNTVDVFLAPSVDFDVAQLSRMIITSSACGICGRTSIESVHKICSERPRGDFRLEPDRLTKLTEVLSGAQPVFSGTGGLHAAALFDPEGELLDLREDVGRHNALDKLVGGLLRAAKLPASESLVLVSGRASFELVQKALLAGIPALAAVGAPSSLAVELARDYDMTLIGFLRGDRFNVYSGQERIATG